MIRSVLSLLLGMGILLAGSGLLGTALGLRATHEGMDASRIGLIMSGYFVGYVAGYWICPPIVRRVGFIRAFTAFAAVTAVTAIAYGIFVHPLAWFSLRVVNGIGVVGVYMIIESWLGARAGAARARLFAAYMTVNLLGLAAGQALVSLYPVNLLNLFAIAAGLFCLGLIPIALTPVAEPSRIDTTRVRLIRLLRVSPAGAAGGLISGMVVGSFWALGAVYALAVGRGAAEVATLIAAAVLGGAALQWPIGWLSNRTDRRLVLVGVSTMAAAAVLWMYQLGRMLPEQLHWGAAAFGATAFAIYGLSIAQTQERFAAGNALEATKGLLLLHGIGAISGPICVGVLMRNFGAGAFPVSLSVLCLLLALFVLWRVRLDPPVPEADRETFLPVNQTSPAAMDLDPRSHGD